MDNDPLADFEKFLIGHRCTFQRREADWVANLDGNASVSLEAPWRIVAGGRIAFADEDDGQRFGLPAPVNGEFEANRLLTGKTITHATIDRETADLTLYFDGNVRVDVFNHSSGYEGWQANFSLHGQNVCVVALGGGAIAVLGS